MIQQTIHHNFQSDWQLAMLTKKNWPNWILFTILWYTMNISSYKHIVHQQFSNCCLCNSIVNRNYSIMKLSTDIHNYTCFIKTINQTQKISTLNLLLVLIQNNAFTVCVSFHISIYMEVMTITNQHFAFLTVLIEYAHSFDI